MDREEFKKKMENHTVMTDDMMSNIQALHLKNTKKSEIYIVAMEELSELQKEISKELRGQGDRTGRCHDCMWKHHEPAKNHGCRTSFCHGSQT